METVGQIIRRRREALELTLAALADEVGSTKSYLSMIENHRVLNPPSAQLLNALERALRITDGELVRAADWQNTPAAVREQFVTMAKAAQSGQELAKWLKENSVARKKDRAKDLDALIKSGALSKRVNATLKTVNKAQPSLDALVPVRFQVPLINKVAAGYPSDFTDKGYPARVADEYVACPDLNDPDAFAARVVGDSMEPEYLEGDIVIFSPAAKPTDGSDCFVRIEPDHECTFKRVFFEDDGRIRLQPLNQRFPPTVYKRDLVSGLFKAVTKISAIR